LFAISGVTRAAPPSYDIAIVGLTGSEFTRVNGYRSNYFWTSNEAGQVMGVAARCNGGKVELGYSAFLNHPVSATVNELDNGTTDADGYAYTEGAVLTENGSVLRSYSLFDEGGNYVGDPAFYLDIASGSFDLGMLVFDRDFVDRKHLASVTTVNGPDAILGLGLLADIPSGRMAYLLTPHAVPVPAAAWLFMPALAALLRRRHCAMVAH
jgi:hypothetical protein